MARVECPWCLCLFLHVSLHVSLMVLWWWLWARWLRLGPLPAFVCILDVFCLMFLPVSRQNASSWVSSCIALCVESLPLFSLLAVALAREKTFCSAVVALPVDLVPPSVGWSFLRSGTSTSWRKCRNASNTNCERLTVFRCSRVSGIPLSVGHPKCF